MLLHMGNIGDGRSGGAGGDLSAAGPQSELGELEVLFCDECESWHQEGKEKKERRETWRPKGIPMIEMQRMIPKLM